MGRSSEAAMARGATYVVLLFALLIAVFTRPDGGHPMARRLAGGACALAVFALFLWVRQRVTTLQPVHWWWGWTAGAIAMVPLWLSDQWATLGVSAAMIGLLGGQWRWSWLGNAALALGMVLSAITSSQPIGVFAGIAGFVTLIAVVLYVLTRLVMLIQQLRLAQQEVARAQVDKERARISRDLHDILGRTLTAVSLRNQAAIQLVPNAPDKALVQMEAAHKALVEGRTQLRALTSGPVVAGLNQEVESTAALCRAMGIIVITDIVDIPDGENASICARVVREATTNMLKHSRPTRCVITIREEVAGLVVSIANDGTLAVQPPSSGTGLRDLQRRVEIRGGTLDAGPADKNQYSVVVRLPRETNPDS